VQPNDFPGLYALSLEWNVTSEAPPQRKQNLASCYENALTIILRLPTFQKQSSANAQDFRASVRAAFKAAMEQAKGVGYSSESNQLAFFAVVALLDESVLKLQHPGFADWAQRPFQEEMFGHYRAGEVFFEHLHTLLARPDSAETADCLEVYCLCMQLGFHGKYALGYASAQPGSHTGSWSAVRPSGEIRSLIRQAHDKIVRIRGPLTLLPQARPPVVKKIASVDPWSRALGIIALILLIIFGLSFALSWFALSSGLSQLS
jgi:type VI secretion system protein ImpK